MNEFFLGEIRVFPFGIVPSGWMACNGQQLTINQNQALYALIGNKFGTAPAGMFNLPDLRGRSIVSTGVASSGTAYTLGQSGGVAAAPLTAAMLPAHSHWMNGTGASGTTNSPAGALLAAPTAGAQIYGAPSSPLQALASGSVENAGSANATHENMQPYMALNFCIAVTGIWPSRG